MTQHARDETEGMSKKGAISDLSDALTSISNAGQGMDALRDNHIRHSKLAPRASMLGALRSLDTQAQDNRRYGDRFAAPR